MFRKIWSKEDITGTDPLQYKINATGCKIKVQNSSRFAVDVFIDENHEDRIEPYSYSVLPNSNYTLKLNRETESEQVQPNEEITFKTVADDSQTGSTTFTGKTNVEGDMNITGGQVDAFIQGDMTLAPDTEIKAQIVNQGPLEVNGKMDANIVNEGPLEVSGDMNAHIQNAELNSNIINTKLSTNELVYLGETTIQVQNLTDDGFNFASGTIETEQGFGLYDEVMLICQSQLIYDVQPDAYPIYDFTVLPTFDAEFNTSQHFQISNVYATTSQDPSNNYTIPQQMRVHTRAKESQPISKVWIGLQRSTHYYNETGDPQIDYDQLKVKAYAFNRKEGTEANPSHVKITNIADFRDRVLEVIGSLGLDFDPNLWKANGNAALRLNNGDIDGANGIYFNDGSNSESEGMIFKNDDGSESTLRVYEGNLYLGGQKIASERGQSFVNFRGDWEFVCSANVRYGGYMRELRNDLQGEAQIDSSGRGIFTPTRSGVYIVEGVVEWESQSYASDIVIYLYEDNQEREILSQTQAEYEGGFQQDFSRVLWLTGGRSYYTVILSQEGDGIGDQTWTTFTSLWKE